LAADVVEMRFRLKVCHDGRRLTIIFLTPEVHQWVDHTKCIVACLSLIRNPVFTATSICVLALGMCASAVYVRCLERSVLRSLPYASPERVLFICETKKQQKADNLTVASAKFEDWRYRNHVLEEMALVRGAVFDIAAS
jgi:hypothetical protein